MHIIVCAKQVPDPEAAFSMFKVDEQARKVIPAPGLQLVMSPFDEQAVEAALRIRECQADTRITVASMGPETARNAIRHGLAMGADEGVLLSDTAFDDADSYTTACTLAAAIRKLGACDLVLTGRQAADRDAGVDGARNIVAINTDPDAAIFRDARFGVIGDFQKVVPALAAEVRKLISGKRPSEKRLPKDHHL